MKGSTDVSSEGVHGIGELDDDDNDDDDANDDSDDSQVDRSGRMAASRTPSLTPSRSSTPVFPVQPDHFFGADGSQLPPSPHSDARPWLDPADDPLAHRGIPVFKPTMDEFADFELYMSRVECWGVRSGIVKVIPPQEWSVHSPYFSCLPRVMFAYQQGRRTSTHQGSTAQRQDKIPNRAAHDRTWWSL